MTQSPGPKLNAGYKWSELIKLDLEKEPLTTARGSGGKRCVERTCKRFKMRL